MSKKRSMEDVIPPEKRTIRRVSLGESSRKNRSSKFLESVSRPSVPEDTQIQNVDAPKKSTISGMTFDSSYERPQKESILKKKWVRFSLIFLVIVIFVLIVLNFFSGATITITPRQEEITIDGVFAANKTRGIDVLLYEIFSFTRDDEESVDASGEKYVEAKASGTIIIFNNFDEKGQLLIANTRFESPEGLVYRIQDPVTVPGRTANTEGKVIPGSLEVRVLADKPGEKYDIGLSDFTLPGLKESGDIERFEAFFARSKTSMTGGFAGVQKTIDTQDAENAVRDIDERLAQELQAVLEAELSEDFVVYKDAIFTTFIDLPQGTSDKEGEVTIRRRGTVQAVVYNKHDLAAFVAENSIAAYDGDTVVLQDPLVLSFTLLEKDTFNAVGQETFEFSLKGQTRLIWDLDEERLRQDLADKHKRDTAMVLSAYPAIKEADIAIYPFWKQSFPEDEKKIRIEYDTE